MVSDVAGLVAALRAGDDVEFLGCGFLAGGDETPDTDRIDRHGLLGKHMLAGLDRGFEVLGAIVRRRREDDVVDVVDREELLECVHAQEAPIVLDLLALAVEFLLGVVQTILGDVGDGDDLDALGRGQDIVGGTGATSAGSDQADLDRRIGLGRASETRERATGCRRDRRRLDELAPGQPVE